MRQSRLGIYYSELVRRRRTVRKFVKISKKYKSDLLSILERLNNIERRLTINHPLLQEVVTELAQISQDIEHFSEEDHTLSCNLSRLPLG